MACMMVRYLCVVCGWVAVLKHGRKRSQGRRSAALPPVGLPLARVEVILYS